MGSGASRPRPRPAETHQAPYQNYVGPTAAGPYFLGPPHTGYHNNGQYYGGFPGSRTQHCSPPAGAAQNTLGADKQLSPTATIRNAVNVKKTTIAVTPSAQDSSKLIISFQFDASAPCLVSAFVAATEATNDACRINPSLQQPAAGVQYSKGLGLSFQRGDADVDITKGAVIDLRQYDEQELLRVSETSQGPKYPLIIRLETVTERGIAAGHSLDELQPGGPQKAWVQSQTTFAQLTKDDDSLYTVRTLKQKIWVEGVSYELQEIYGIEHATAAAKDREGVVSGTVAAEQEEERSCVICMVNARDTTVLPCRHMCMCHDCAQELRKQTSKCPICRNHVESLLHIRMARQEAPRNPATPLDQSTVSAALDKLKLKASNERSAIEKA